jgi:hypothetical protein
MNLCESGAAFGRLDQLTKTELARTFRASTILLFADLEFLNEPTVPVEVLLGEIIKQAATLAYHL